MPIQSSPLASPPADVSRRGFLARLGAATVLAAVPPPPVEAAGAQPTDEHSKIRAEQDRPRKVSDRGRRLVEDTVTINMTHPKEWADETFKRYRSAGFSVVSVSVEDLAEIGRLRRLVAEHEEEYLFVRGYEDIARTRATRRLAIGINCQDSAPLGGNLDLVRVFRSLGLISMNLAYNTRNLAADGCAEPTDSGLSRFGRALVKEMRKVGVLCDGAHTGHRSTLEAMEVYEGPFVFTHANCKAVFDHYRNIGDDQIRACAATGGVIGINGAGRLLDDPYASAQTMFRHIDHVVSLVGWQHVGIGLDWIRDIDAMWRRANSNKDLWPDNDGRPLQYATFAPPEVVGEIVDLMLNHGYGEDEIRGYLGRNFQRVLEAVWR